MDFFGDEFDFHHNLVDLDTTLITSLNTKLAVLESKVATLEEERTRISKLLQKQSANYTNPVQQEAAHQILNSFWYPSVVGKDGEVYDRFEEAEDRRLTSQVYDLYEKRWVPRLIASPFGSGMVFDRLGCGFRKRRMMDDFRVEGNGVAMEESDDDSDVDGDEDEEEFELVCGGVRDGVVLRG